MNKYICSGVIGHDFDEILGGVKTSLAIRLEDKSTMWAKILIFGNTAVAAKINVGKGSKILVEGSLIEDISGNGKLTVLADRIEYL